MEALTTIKSKSEFIKNNSCRYLKYGQAITPYNINLLQDMLEEFKDTTVIGWKSLPNVINSNIIAMPITASNLEALNPLPAAPNSSALPYDAYNGFMRTSGMPAILKLAVLKELAGH